MADEKDKKVAPKKPKAAKADKTDKTVKAEKPKKAPKKALKKDVTAKSDATAKTGGGSPKVSVETTKSAAKAVISQNAKIIRIAVLAIVALALVAGGAVAYKNRYRIGMWWDGVATSIKYGGSTVTLDDYRVVDVGALTPAIILDFSYKNGSHAEGYSAGQENYFISITQGSDDSELMSVAATTYEVPDDVDYDQSLSWMWDETAIGETTTGGVAYVLMSTSQDVNFRIYDENGTTLAEGTIPAPLQTTGEEVPVNVTAKL